MLSGINTKVDRAALARVFADPKTLLAVETALSTVQDTPEAVNLAQATADTAVANAAAAQATANGAVIDAAGAQATADAAVLDAAAAQADATTAIADAAAAQADADALETALQGAKTANFIYAGPTSGAAAAPTFRAMVVADLPAPPTFSAHRNGTDQTGIVSGVFTKVQLTNEDWDVGACFDTTNHRWTPNQAGRYQINALVGLALPAAGVILATLYKNGAEYKRGGQLTVAAAGSLGFSVLAEANGSTDYFELYVFQSSGGNATLSGGAAFSYMQGAFIAK